MASPSAILEESFIVRVFEMQNEEVKELTKLISEMEPSFTKPIEENFSQITKKPNFIVPIVENIIKSKGGDEVICFIETFEPDLSLMLADGNTLR